eukprot:Selendium_serpulae@DN2075_c0_g1_i3.p2
MQDLNTLIRGIMSPTPFLALSAVTPTGHVSGAAALLHSDPRRGGGLDVGHRQCQPTRMWTLQHDKRSASSPSLGVDAESGKAVDRGAAECEPLDESSVQFVAPLADALEMDEHSLQEWITMCKSLVEPGHDSAARELIAAASKRQSENANDNSSSSSSVMGDESGEEEGADNDLTKIHGWCLDAESEGTLLLRRRDLPLS